jgi:ankyrin repeat protein
MLRNKTLDINVCDELTGVNSFWLACLWGHGDIMKILAEAGIEIYVSNNRNINVFHLAIIKNHIDIVEMLLASFFQLNEETCQGSTGLYLAAYLNHYEISEMILNHLIEGGFKKSIIIDTISHINYETNMSPLGLTLLMDHKQIAIQLITNGAKCYYEHNFSHIDDSPIFIACEQE